MLEELQENTNKQPDIRIQYRNKTPDCKSQILGEGKKTLTGAL